jgi:diguanylate cyclase (GGDEF)-like protein
MAHGQAGWMKRLLSLVAPDGVVLIAAVIAVRLDALRDSLPGFARFFPYAVFIVGALLAWRFQRNRLLLALLVLALATAAVGRPAGEPAGEVAFRATALLLPLNLAALALLPDRGTLTQGGLLRLGAIVLQLILVALFSRTAPAATAALLGHPLLPAALSSWTPLQHPALFAFTLALGGTVVPLIFEPNTMGRGFLWAIVASFLAVTAHRPGPAPAIYLGTAGLVLIVSVIETSYLLAYQDGLTQLPARRALTEALQRLGGQYTIAMIDVDHFKRFNDEYGHDVGDHVLRMVAAKLARVEGGGRAYRYGGEEFAILFPGKAVEETLPHLEAVREAVAESAFTIRGRIRVQRKREQPKGNRPRRRQAFITVSIGVAERNSRRGVPDHVIRAADQALYRAKESGRNRICS